MKAKLDGFLNPQVALMKYKETDTGFPARYARAIAYYQMKEPDRALKLLEAMITEQSRQSLSLGAQGPDPVRVRPRGPGRGASAQARWQLKPDAPCCAVNLGQTLISLDDPKKIEEGVQELKRSLLNDPDNAVAWRLLAQAYDTQKKGRRARLATAEQYYSLGAVQEAKVFAMRARELLTRTLPTGAAPPTSSWPRARRIRT
jgi:predicted Zn-dependent protease